MDKETMKEVIRQSAFQVLVLVVMTFAGLLAVTFILDPKSVTAFFR